MNTPTPDQIREAWSILRGGYQPIRFRTYNEAYDAAWKVLEDALAQPASEASPPPVVGAHTPADCCKRAAEAITNTYALDKSHPYRGVVREIRDWLRDGGEQ